MPFLIEKVVKGLLLFKGENDKYGPTKMLIREQLSQLLNTQEVHLTFGLKITSFGFTSKGFALIDANGEKVIETGQLDYQKAIIS